MSWEFNEKFAKYFSRSSGTFSGEKIELVFNINEYVFKIFSWIIANAAVYYVYLKTGNIWAMICSIFLYVLLIWLFFQVAFFLSLALFQGESRFGRIANRTLSITLSLIIFFFVTTGFEEMIRQLAGVR